MSRCFPFPPPGYVRIGATGDALIDSIKLHKEKEKAQTDRKRESKIKKKGLKTEKKESRKEIKEKDKNGEKKEKRREKQGDRSDSKKRKVSDIFQEVKKSQLDPKEKSLHKKPEVVVEQLEKSCLTEEHELLNSTNLCYSSDGTQSGDQRKRDSLPSTSNQSNGNIIRIRMSIGKQKDAEAPLSQGQQCAKSVKAKFSGITQLPVQKQYASASTPATIGAKEVPRQPDPGLLPSTSGKNDSLPADSPKTSLKFKSVDKKLLKKEKLYNALTENWLPIPLIHDQVDADDDDQDWLFKSKSGDNHAAKRLKACNDSPFQDSCSYGPRACYLPEVDIYALPYVMPF